MDVKLALHLFGQKMYCEDWRLSFPVFDGIKNCGQKKSQVGQHKTQTKFCIVFRNLFIGVFKVGFVYLGSIMLIWVPPS